jgi:hypothetical protein
MFCALRGEVAATGAVVELARPPRPPTPPTKDANARRRANGRASGQVLRDAHEAISTVIE